MILHPKEIRYATGEVAMLGDHVRNGEHLCIVEEIVASAEAMEAWGLSEAGLMLVCRELGRVFEPANSISWDDIVFERRAQ